MSGYGSSSVNGTRVLADMFTDRGHRVESYFQLSPSLNSADAIVWFPDDFEPPSSEVRSWLDNWLLGGSNRTLIYVGRDFDAAPGYWKKISGQVAPGDQTHVSRQLQEAKNEATVDRKEIPDDAANEWFAVSGKLDQRDVRELAGPWSQGVDAQKVDIELNGRLAPDEWARPLLESGDDILVARFTQDSWRGSQFVTVANGSFLLNLPLVNHEHRKLAGKLIGLVGPPRKKVVFLQSSAGGPEILDKEPEPPQFNALDILGVWPLGGVLLQLTLLGIIFAFARWPIFGRPQVPATAPASDFGKHVTALGQLLARTRNREYALARLAQWQRGRSSDPPRRQLTARGLKHDRSRRRPVFDSQ